MVFDLGSPWFEIIIFLPWLVWALVDFREWRSQKNAGETTRSYVDWHNERKMRPWVGEEPFWPAFVTGIGYGILWIGWVGLVFLFFG
tara:strand:+ start:15883 stop:16143 length:261 start_codon:yes stop_codon:yes gene_type:complete